MSHQILYLGLDPPPGVIHYPVIRTERIDGPAVNEALQLWPQFSHVVFKSKTAVRYWFEIRAEFEKIAVAVGKATAKELRLRKVNPLVATEETQEGIVELLKREKPDFVFLPRSKRARSVLTNYLKQESILFLVLDLYDVVFQTPIITVDLQEIDEIVFTSPSTVEGFLKIFGALPQDKILTPIGPVTANSLDIETKRNSSGILSPKIGEFFHGQR